MVEFCAVYNCLKNIEVLQYCNTFLCPKSIGILFQPNIAISNAILFQSIDCCSVLLESMGL